MITQSTAGRIVDVFEEMDKCECALVLIRDAIDFTGCVVVSSDKNEEGYTINLSLERAEKIIRKQLRVLEKEYEVLNEVAIEEVKE